MNRQGRYFLSAKFKAFEEKVRWEAKSQFQEKPYTKDIMVHILVHFKNKVHADATNLFKGVMDALQGICYENDRQVKQAQIIVEEGKPDSFFVDIYEIY